MCVGAVVSAVCGGAGWGDLVGRLALGAAKLEVEVVEPDGFGPRDPIWDRASVVEGRCGGCRGMRRGRG